MSMTESEYRNHPALNWSLLKELQKSPAHFQYRRQVPLDDSPALRIGRALHCSVLQPEQWHSEYILRPKFAGTGAVAARKQWEEQHCEMTQLSDDEMQTVIGMSDAISSQQTVSILLEDCNFREHALFATHISPSSESTVEIKGKIDAYSKALKCLVDVKTCQDASREACSRLIFNYGYHCQLAFYKMLAEANGLPVESCVLIFVEKSAPHGVAAYYLSETALAAGQETAENLLDRYITCSGRNQWPGYPDVISEISLPRWAANNNQQIEEGDF